MSFLARFRRKREDPEVVRRRQLLQFGRLGEASVLETRKDGDGNVMLSYSYTVGGVDYQAFQRLDEEQLRRAHDYFPDARVDMRYDPQRPVNSFVV
jgi:hypothetical protein